MHASYAFALPVPGGTVPCSGLTWVGVRPDERRRGLLTAMIDLHFERSLGRGEPVSALFAAEPAIYGRFGYGSAADDVRLKVAARCCAAPRRRRGPDRDVRDRRPRAARGPRQRRVPPRGRGSSRLDAAVDATRCASARSWTRRRGATAASRCASSSCATPTGDPRAYALLRRKEVWAEPGPRYLVKVREAAALDPAAAHRLWSFVLDLDLTSEVETGLLAADDALLHLLVDQRATVPRLNDNVWVRVLDVPAALAARRYSAPLDVVLDVRDAHVPANARAWRLTTGAASDDGYAAQVTPSDDEPDLSLDVRELGAAYLGGRSVAAQASAGLVAEHRPGAVRAVAAAFAWPVAPVCPFVF